MVKQKMKKSQVKDKMSVALICANIVLVAITAFYGYETRAIRKIAEQSLQVEACAKPFIEKVRCVPRLLHAKKCIEVAPIFTIGNAGTVEARDVIVEYELSSGSVTIEKEFQRAQYLFPGQEVTFKTKILTINLSEDIYEILKKAAEAGSPVTFSKKFDRPIFVTLTMKYQDHAGNEQSLPYSFKYVFIDNAWVYATRPVE